MKSKVLFKQGALWGKLQTSYPRGKRWITSWFFGTQSERSRDTIFKGSAKVAYPMLIGLRFAAVFLMLLTLGVGNAWGAETLYETIIMKDNGSDSGTAYTTSTAISTAFESPTDSIKAITSVSGVYPGNSGWKFGANSNPGSITFSLAHTIKKVTKIEVSVKRYNTKNVNLNCNNIGAQTINSSSYSTKTYTYTTATDISSITLVTTKPSSGDYRCYVQSIKIYYDKPASGTSVSLSQAGQTNGSF